MWKRVLRSLKNLAASALGDPGVEGPGAPGTEREEIEWLAEERRRLRRTLEYYRSCGLNGMLPDCEAALERTETRYRFLKCRLRRE